MTTLSSLRRSIDELNRGHRQQRSGARSSRDSFPWQRLERLPPLSTVAELEPNNDPSLTSALAMDRDPVADNLFKGFGTGAPSPAGDLVD